MSPDRRKLWVIFTAAMCLVAIVAAALFLWSKPSTAVVGAKATGVAVRVSVQPFKGLPVREDGQRVSDVEFPPGFQILFLHVTVENTSTTKKVGFIGWNNVPGKPLSIVDDLGNKYEAMDWGRMLSIDGKTIYPGESATLVLQPQQMIPAAKSLKVTLPGEAIGETGPMVFDVSLVDVPHKDFVIVPAN